MAKENPHLLLLDEPTNHLDMESIDSLANAINKFQGGMVLVSHDMRLISQVAKEIWVCDNKTVMKYVGEISDFKMQIQQQLEKDSLIDAGTTKKKQFSTESGPLLVPLGAPRRYGNEDAKTLTVAPPKPSSEIDFPALDKSPKPKTEEEEIMAARMELAELAIKRQRDRQAKEKAAKVEMSEEEKKAVEELKEKKKKEKEEAAEREAALREETKARKLAEKEKKKKYEEEQEALREQRRLEKEADMAEAKRLQEKLEAERKERQRLREEKAAKEKKEEDERLAAEQAAKDARKAERQRIKREKEEAKEKALQEAKEKWMNEARTDVWTQEQQTAFEQALLTAPLILETRGNDTMEAEKKNRWNYIADRVPGKHRNQCLLRYKLLLQVVKDHKAMQAKC
jgi:ABC-type glutathione transport system ATPase component